VDWVVEAAEPGDFTLSLIWDGPVKATDKLRWQPGEIQVPTISPYILLSGIGMILVAAGYVIYAAVRRLGWGYLGLGAGAWIATVVLKFVWAVPVNPSIYAALTGALPESLATVAFSIYVGSLTGFTEVLLTWFLLRYTKLGRVPWGRALAFGIGFGAVEALLLGANSVIGVVTAIVSPSALSLEALEQIASQTTPLYIAAPVWERFFTVLIHIFANVCLFYGVVRGRARWLWVSFVFKSAIDAVAAWAQFGLLSTVGGLWIVEGIVAVFGIGGWLGIRWIGAHYPEVETGQAST
ncbi:MAG: YhfC family glutamic-type intramembrane protease, partial [Anaerolineae bacterium]